MFQKCDVSLRRRLSLQLPQKYHMMTLSVRKGRHGMWPARHSNASPLLWTLSAWVTPNRFLSYFYLLFFIVWIIGSFLAVEIRSDLTWEFDTMPVFKCKSADGSVLMLQKDPGICVKTCHRNSGCQPEVLKLFSPWRTKLELNGLFF